MVPVENRLLLQNAATTGNGNAVQLNGAGREHSFYLQPTGTISAGAVTIETARTADYAGTWAVLAGPITIVQDTTIVVNHTGCLLAIRARVSTNVTGGGSVTVETVSN